MTNKAITSKSRKNESIPQVAELAAITNFSFLHGASHPDEMVAQAKALGLSAIAIADRNTLAGVVRAHTAAKDVGLRLLVGARLALAGWPELVCLPTDRAAYGRLSRLLSLGQMRAEKGQCELTLADIAAHAEGQVFIILPPDEWDWREARSLALHPPAPPAQPATSKVIAFPGTIQGEGLTRSLPDLEPTCPPQNFSQALARLKQSLSGSHLYLGLPHRYDGNDRARLAALQELANRNAICTVAATNALYHAAHRKPLQDVLTCIREKTTITNAGMRLEANAERHLKSPSQIARLYRGHEAAIARTMDIVDLCRFSLDELVYEYPDEPVPPGATPQSHLEDLVWQGAAWRFAAGIPDKVRETITKELALIAQLNYAQYFLTVHDIVRFARARGILCQGRGSAANSVVCYCLGITAVNPTEVDLLFERFVSPERKEPPDIDVDFEHERREEVIQYIYARYGRDRAGLAATVICYRGRLALREVGKAMGLTEDVVAALAGMVWGAGARGGLPEKYVREAGLDPDDPLLATVIELSQTLTGFPRHLSQHVGGFVLTRGPLVEVVPVGNAAMPERTFIEWDKDDLEALGLLKVDVLALGMLSCIHRAFDLMATHHDRSLTLASVPREDPEVYDMLCRADSIGVFQVESRAQMNMLPRLKPRTYYDLVIEVAIVRPGPIQGDMVHPYLRRRDGLEAEEYPAPDPNHGPPDELRRILGKTKGVPLFQEQAMRIALEAAKFNNAEINELRRALATFRKRGTIHKLEAKMVERMVARGYDRDFAARCFNQIKGFGEYGFPESHAASFAHLVYVSSWFKHHYPEVFCCAILNAQPMGFYAPAQLVRDARNHGVDVRPVDVVASDWDSTLEDPTPQQRARGVRPAVRLGLRQVDGLGEEEARKISGFREAMRSGEITSIHALWQASGAKRATLEKLAAADAFRGLGCDRRAALWEVKALGSDTVLPLFGWAQCSETGNEPQTTLPEMALSEHVVNDYQTLRLSLKAHPMSFLRDGLARRRIVTCDQLRHAPDGARASVAGVVLVRQRPGSAKGVVFMTLEDETGVCNTVVWPNMLERFRKVIMTARLIVVHGRIQRHEDIIHLVCQRLEDRSDLLLDLSEWREDMRVPIANADEVLRPDPGSARTPDHPRWAGHPRNERVVPKRIDKVMPRSRDFH